MKLWQKLFLSSLSLIIIAIDIVSVTVLSNNHRLLLEREKAHAVREFDYFAASFANALTYEQLRSDKVALTDEDISAIANDLFSRSNRPSAAFKTDGSEVAVSIFPELGITISDQNFIDSVLAGGNNYTVRIFSDEKRSMLTIGSLTEAAGENYLLITATDVSEIYAVKEQQTRFIRQVSIISAAVVSLILLVTTILLLRPLNRLNTYTKAIAGGNYRIRIRKRGSQEFRELAENMNIRLYGCLS
ncbi:MAG: HAMP domain-containing protein [Ruminococcus sp.]|nr:HAMP domain-containing protein [Ruminococcus sp.]